MNNTSVYYNEIKKGIEKLIGTSIKKNPLKKFKAYKNLIHIYMKKDVDRQISREEEYRKILDKLQNDLVGVSKLHLGCGSNFVKGWLNIGLFPKEEISMKSLPKSLTKINEALVLNFNLTENLPISSNSIEYIYASHFIEHLNFGEGITFLRQCYDLMQKEGIIRLTCPDMELWIRKYYENDIGFFSNYRSIFAHGIHPLVETKGEIFMSQVHNWSHKWNYDFDSIYHILQMIGFKKILKKSFHESEIPEIRILEPDTDGRKLETMYVEAQKG